MRRVFHGGLTPPRSWCCCNDRSPERMPIFAVHKRIFPRAAGVSPQFFVSTVVEPFGQRQASRRLFGRIAASPLGQRNENTPNGDQAVAHSAGLPHRRWASETKTHPTPAKPSPVRQDCRFARFASLCFCDVEFVKRLPMRQDCRFASVSVLFCRK